MYLVYNIHFYQSQHELPLSKPHFLLLQLDYLGLYFPEIWFYKFEYIRTLLKTSLSKETISTEYGIKKIDLTYDFRRLADLENFPYERFGQLMYNLCINHINTSDIPLYKPFFPFLDFLGLTESVFSSLRPTT